MINEKYNQKIAEYHAWRGIAYPCEECQGTGKKTYGSTATFWGGIGGAAMTTSVCDKCWGSGEKHQPWKSWKLIRSELEQRAPLYDRLRIAVWKVMRARDNKEDINRPFGEVLKILNFDKKQ